MNYIEDTILYVLSHGYSIAQTSCGLVICDKQQQNFLLKEKRGGTPEDVYRRLRERFDKEILKK